jgi:hypothetical protein
MAKGTLAEYMEMVMGCFLGVGEVGKAH